MAAAVPYLIGGGAVLGAAGSLMDSQEKAFALEQEAEASFMNARLSRQEGIYNAERQAIAAEHTIGGVKAGYAASNVSQDSASAVAVLRQSYTNAELDRQNILYGSEMEARNFEARGRAAQRAAKGTRRAGRVSAAATLLSGGGMAAYYGGR